MCITKNDVALMQNFVEALKQLMLEDAKGLVAASGEHPVLFSYQSDLTPMRARTRFADAGSDSRAAIHRQGLSWILSCDRRCYLASSHAPPHLEARNSDCLLPKHLLQDFPFLSNHDVYRNDSNTNQQQTGSLQTGLCPKGHPKCRDFSTLLLIHHNTSVHTCSFEKKA